MNEIMEEYGRIPGNILVIRTAILIFPAPTILYLVSPYAAITDNIIQISVVTSVMKILFIKYLTKFD